MFLTLISNNYVHVAAVSFKPLQKSIGLQCNLCCEANTHPPPPAPEPLKVKLPIATFFPTSVKEDDDAIMDTLCDSDSDGEDEDTNDPEYEPTAECFDVMDEEIEDQK